jgi:(p)ppGpp synthase/HD superfamily hydrolase
MGEAITLTDPIEDMGLKDMSQEELSRRIIEDQGWTPEERQMVASAYDLALRLHAEDTHRDQPYIYHLLRSANRAAGYLKVHDAEIIAAILLHDSVEDHASGIADAPGADPKAAQQAALDQLGQDFSPRVAQLVELVTNEPPGPQELSYEEELAKYAAKVEIAISTADGWIIKFVDWCDNAIGIKHGAAQLSGEQIIHFQRKYGGDVLAALESRFRQPDIQARLDTFAKGYVESQLKLGHQRLIDNEALANQKKPSLIDKWFRAD